jgi:chitosanase
MDHCDVFAVGIFSTAQTPSRVLGDYGQVTLLPGDSGQLSYGRSQATLTSGTLAALIQSYCSQNGARFEPQLSPFLPKLSLASPLLNTNGYFHNLLRASADDPTMREVQDQFFDQHYWRSATNSARSMGITTPLGIAVVYDSRIHGSWRWMRERTNRAVGLLPAVGEKKWVKAYVHTRRHWLANHSKAILRNTVYRMNTFMELIALRQWSLELPLVVRNLEISLASLSAQPGNTYKGPSVRSRDILVKSPLMRGLDVRLVQLTLSSNRIKVNADGVFGNNSAKAVRDYQKKSGLPETGRIGSADFSNLGL